MNKQKRVVIGMSESGIPYVVSKSKNVDVIFKKSKKQTLKKKVKSWLYHIQQQD